MAIATIKQTGEHLSHKIGERIKLDFGCVTIIKKCPSKTKTDSVSCLAITDEKYLCTGEFDVFFYLFDSKENREEYKEELLEGYTLIEALEVGDVINMYRGLNDKVDEWEQVTIVATTKNSMKFLAKAHDGFVVVTYSIYAGEGYLYVWDDFNERTPSMNWSILPAGMTTKRLLNIMDTENIDRIVKAGYTVAGTK